jgi:hypothetical protein
MTPDAETPVIAHAIQLALTPVFLLTGIAGLLNVMATRLGRIIDRAREFDRLWPTLDATARQAAERELGELESRRRMASWAINFCTFSALVVCNVVATLFIDGLFATDLKWFAGAQFIAAMVSLIGGLACFLREVYVATHTMRIMAARFRR